MEVSRSNMSYKFMDIDINNINYTKTKYTTNKSKLIMLNYNNKPFVIQTPYLLNITNIQNIQNITDIEVALIGREQNSVKKFIDFITNIQSKIKKDAMIYSDAWFDLKNNNKVNFEKIIRTSSSYSSGTIKLKLVNNNDFKTILDMSQLDNNQNALIECWSKMLLEFYAIRINSQNILSICLRPISISFKPKDIDIYNKFNFIDDSEVEDINDSDDNDNNNNYTEVPLKTKTNKLLNLLSNKSNNITKVEFKTIPEEEVKTNVNLHNLHNITNNLSDKLSTTSENEINDM
jgi:hypothetical protein